ncbi:hypothetical protein BFJ70_g12832 [Fusarium oxysporum]|uniref:Uncharacterized protein n=1 Tax=Fusarium oxysporum f. sp. cepae TaxID=396571 RepID=A0A3L6P0B2_FUSOX|nr:hypothetical protein BFJ65_g3496 [Fusarium oxysporum f. sp. cepae]RKK50264.1 hypothetical protein BFJ67_g6465 [Fusarium oxysporum f. sp. cepae]RKL23634.1 hypothetical protein BFJ70_g12832 [Fusarium oxysporum]
MSSTKQNLHIKDRKTVPSRRTRRANLLGVLTIGPARLGTYEDDNSGEQGLSQAEAKIAASVMTRTYT